MADPVLVCTAGKLLGKRFRVPDARALRFGRAEDNDVVVEDDGVSRFHAELMLNNGSLWLQDAGSRNGVFVNGARVTTHQQLKVGDEVAIADHKFKIKWDDEPDEAPAADKGGEQKAGKRRWFWPFS